MDRQGFAACVPQEDASVVQKPLIDLSSGYVLRAMDTFPRQGDRKPWRLHQNYVLDLMTLKLGALDDGTMKFTRRGVVSERAA